MSKKVLPTKYLGLISGNLKETFQWHDIINWKIITTLKLDGWMKARTYSNHNLFIFYLRNLNLIKSRLRNLPVIIIQQKNKKMDEFSNNNKNKYLNKMSYQ